MNKLAILSVVILLLASSCGKIDDEYKYGETPDIDWAQAANSSTGALIAKFWNNEGYFNYGSNESDKGFQYWPNAHAMDVLVDAWERTGDAQYNAYFDKWFAGIKVKNGGDYYNEFYDDMEWNGLTFLRLYNATKDDKYLSTARELWSDIEKAWNENYADGGLAWKKDMIYSKNACSNGPAAIMAARLYNITKEEKYKEWALKIYEWQKNTLFNRGTGAVYDNINGETGNVDMTALTYNQGTMVGAAVELFHITGDVSFLNDAQKAAYYTITKLIDVNSNILRNEGDGDNALFKGIFMRYFYILLQEENLNSSYKSLFLNFFNKNAETVWLSGCFPDTFLFGSAWSTVPVGESQLTAQASACMLIEAKALYEKSLK
mgnify:CR=1 FL=1